MKEKMKLFVQTKEIREKKRVINGGKIKHGTPSILICDEWQQGRMSHSIPAKSVSFQASDDYC